MCSKGGGSPPVPSAASTTFNSTVTPSPFVQPMYQDFLSRANALSNTPFNPAQLGQVAPLNAEQKQAGSQLFNLGMHLGEFDPAKVKEIESPYIQDVVNTTQGWFNNQNAIQGNDLLSQAIRSGNAFGGDRAGVAEGVLAGQQQLAQAPVIAGLYQSGYTQALDEYNKLKQFGIQGAGAALGWGGLEQAQKQREFDVAQQNAMMQSAYPFQTMNWYGSILGGIGPLLGSTAAGANNPPEASGLGTALGVGSAAVGLGSAALGAFGGSGSGAGPAGQGKRGGSVDDFAFGGSIGGDEDRSDSDSKRDDRGDDRSDTGPYNTPPTEHEIKAPPNIYGQLNAPRQQMPSPTFPNVSGSQQPQKSDTENILNFATKAIPLVAKAAPLFMLRRGGPVPRIMAWGGYVPHLADGGFDDGVSDDSDIPEDYLSGAKMAGDFRPTFYAPGPNDRMEGPWATSMRNPVTREKVPNTLDQYRRGEVDFITAATRPEDYGQGYNVGRIRYRSPEDNKTYEMRNVPAISFDTGSAFRGRPDKIDLATGDFRGWNPLSASNFVARNQAGDISRVSAKDLLRTSGTGGVDWPMPPNAPTMMAAADTTTGAGGGQSGTTGTGGNGGTDTDAPAVPPPLWNPREQTQGIRRPPRATEVAGDDRANVGQGSSGDRTGSMQPSLRAGETKTMPRSSAEEGSFAQRLARNPFWQMGSALLANPGIRGREGMAVGSAMMGMNKLQTAQRASDLLETKPEMVTLPTGEMVWKSGNKMTGTGLFSSAETRARSAEQRAQEAHEMKIGTPQEYEEPGGGLFPKTGQMVWDPVKKQMVPWQGPAGAAAQTPQPPTPKTERPPESPPAPPPAEQPPTPPPPIEPPPPAQEQPPSVQRPTRQTEAMPPGYTGRTGGAAVPTAPAEVPPATGSAQTPPTAAPTAGTTGQGGQQPAAAPAAAPAASATPAPGTKEAWEKLGADWTGGGIRPGVVTQPEMLKARRNEALLSQLSPEDAQYIRDIADYKIDPNKISTKDKFRDRVLRAVTQYDPEYGQGMYAQRQRVLNEYSVGVTARNMQSQDMAVQHIGRALDNNEKLNHYNARWINDLNAMAQGAVPAIRDPKYLQALSAMQQDVHAVSNELMKTYRGGGTASEREAKRIADTLNAFQAPDQLRAALSEASKLLYGRTEASANTYNQTMGGGWQRNPMDWFSPKAKETLERAWNLDPSKPVPPSRDEQRYQQQLNTPSQQDLDYLKRNPDKLEMFRRRFPNYQFPGQ